MAREFSFADRLRELREASAPRGKVTAPKRHAVDERTGEKRVVRQMVEADAQRQDRFPATTRNEWPRR